MKSQSLPTRYIVSPSYPTSLAYRYTGMLCSERSIAATSSCYRSGTHQLDHDLLAKAGIPSSWFPDLKPTGSQLGQIQPIIAKQLGLNPQCKVIACAGHDTSAAVGAIHNPWPQSCLPFLLGRGVLLGPLATSQ